MVAPQIILELVDRFKNNRESYENSRFNETETRIQFLNPFFKALGWDVDNISGYAERYKDVIHEDALKVGIATKAPDYCFTIGGSRKFFLEAKKPAIDIKHDSAPAFQLRRYAWSAKLPLSVLSNFAEFSVYDCRIRPDKNDKASTSRIYYWTCEQYADKWTEIASVFSKEAILKGSFDKFAAATRNKRGTAEVDDEFLKEIETWRELLAKNIALRNSHLNQRELNFSVQQTIDRIIFLRICEDRGIDRYGRLQGLQNGEHTYDLLKQIFHEADERYNSGLFHFREEANRKTPPDKLTLSLKVDDRPLKDIFKRLYYPESPYEFSVLPADILGQVYEQFLGRIIRLTGGGHVKVEEKPEVKKAGGVYYTPTYVVDYIVEHTVGQLLASKSLRTVKQLTVLDPACGSGSFLLGAYQRLLDWYLAAYTREDAEVHAKGRRPRIFRTEKSGWRLTTSERKRVLLEHIYGVDIDPQAVEVTKLSLLLKVLEDESEENLNRNWALFHERALPDLETNIKCGNSLIGPDFYKGKFDFDEEERYRINAFDWVSAFDPIIAAGGFDVVIGNPPYRRELDYKELMDEISDTSFGLRYRTARMDLWYYFVHRGVELLKKGGTLSYIVNAYWMAGTGAEKLIASLQEEAHIDEIFYLGKLRVFRKVSGQHMIIRIAKALSKENTSIKLAAIGSENSAEPYVTGKVAVQRFGKTQSQLFRSGKIDIQAASDDVLNKLDACKPLREFGLVRQGIAENPAAINKKTNRRFGEKWHVGEGVFVLSPEEAKALRLPAAERQLLRRYHELRDLGRYFIRWPATAYVIYSTKETCPNINAFPTIRNHLRRFKAITEERRETRSGANAWWHLHWPRQEAIWAAPKVLCVQMAERPSFVPAVDPAYVPFSVNVFVPNDPTKENINFIAGILNSRLMWKWFHHHAKRRGVGLEINGHVLESAPIVEIDKKDASQGKLREAIVRLVDQIMAAQTQLAGARTAHEKEVLERSIDAHDRRIDQLVYELYGFTAEDIQCAETL